MKMSLDHQWDGNDRGKPKYSAKIRLIAIMPVKKCTWMRFDSNLRLSSHHTDQPINVVWDDDRYRFLESHRTHESNVEKMQTSSYRVR